MYTCGPTVHNYAHIGNFRTFVFVDMLRRYLVYKGYKVEQVMNITDVEDRIIDGIKKTGMSLNQLTEFYTKAFMDDLQSLNILPAEQYPRATENIEEMVSAIGSLIQKGYAYKAEDGSIYFSIRKFAVRQALGHHRRRGQDGHEDRGRPLRKDWCERFCPVESVGTRRPGRLLGHPPREREAGMAYRVLRDVDEVSRRDHRHPHWGMDLRFPHHENEIAQSEALTGKKFVRHWEHSALLTLQGGKMSKSLGNIVTFRDLFNRGIPPRAVRLFLITAHYRDELKLTDASITQAVATLSGSTSSSDRLRIER